MSPETLALLMAFAASAGAFGSGPFPPPWIEYQTQEEMVVTLGLPSNSIPPVGAYLRDTATIILEAECETQEWAKCKAVLVHELVHHLSALTGRQFACRAKEEELAYHISYKWTLENAPAILREVALDPILYLIVTNCRDWP